MANNWHYAKGGEKHGPISAAQLKELVKTGQLAPDDLVWREDMKEWRKASSVKGLFPAQPAVVSKSPPPPPVADGQRDDTLSIWEQPAVIALLCILCFPVGVFLLWKKFSGASGVLATPSISKKWVVIGACVLGVMVIGGIIVTVTQTSAARKEIAEAAKLREQGKHAEAVAIYQSVISERRPFIPDDQEPLVYGRVIDHLTQAGRQQEARQILEKLNRSSSSSSVTPLVESEAGRQLLADIRREQEVERQRKEAEKQKQQLENDPSTVPLANIPTSKFVSASALYEEFNSNEVAADEKYKGKTIFVAGKVQSVEKAPLQGTIIFLTHDNFGSLGVHCLLSRSAARSDALKTVSGGDYVKVRGECDGKSFIGVVMLEDCEFFNVTGN